MKLPRLPDPRELIAFLYTQLDIDQAIAEEAAEDSCLWDAAWRGPTDRHIHNHSPARVLREVEAKRATLQRHERLTGTTTCQLCWPMWCDIYTMATVYSDRPGYQPEWTPHDR